MQIDKTWHLATTDGEVSWTEFELQLWRAFNAFKRWQLECEKMANDNKMSVDELAVLHVIRMNDRPKTIAEVGQLLNRSDYFNINYSVTRLSERGLVKKYQPFKNRPVQLSVTEEGRRNTEKYTEARKNILFGEFSREISGINLKEVVLGLRQIKGVYEEAHRAASTYRSVTTDSG
ncbi:MULTISPECIES: winged helix DNA-binding protein [Pseudomonas]|uniref:Winged helix DNA-binding protein n=1 Tax=Pseudomonas gingeri TaxID=117681 RepID=A0A7Y7WVA7_9PSED|nr:MULTISPECIES: winged helix DNA-binding protein [Pseudomonas]MPQ66573.1 winged helix DNA-binding protein [Pseudomonas sp. MWU12-2323]NWB88343.1 winged helix DNA-binding protein [Pseudomonas gingeri]